ncbi:hypothetical protein T459_02586 [Capsicum annuum]|uniref:Peptidase S8/S53 domain-containing protein n=1 Tax=Capsicum annuum TaxID=4072 RepID=A0A2G3AKC6_CAPAN|nr:hypothetical protein T459_02586 [Capsicum annuum]
MCNRKLIGANYFNKGILANDPTVNISMNSAKDTNSHGTHCGSITAGNFVKGVSHFGYAAGTTRRVAPRARLAMYKFSFSDGSSTSDLIAAMDQIVADGVDIISISFGNHFIPLYEDAISITSFGAMIKGVLVSASAGNRGPSWGTLGNRSPWILCVASGYTDRTFAGTLTLGNWFKIRGWSLFPARAFFRDSSMIYNKTVATYKLDELLAQVPDLEGTNIIYDYNLDEDGFGYLVNFLTSYAGIAKPDIRDPGVHILAAVPPNLPSSTIEPNIQLTTDYELKTGTSMAASHATGITAMVKGVHPEWSPLAIRSAMMTTTNHLDGTQKPIREDGNMIATPLGIVTGHIDPNRALDPGLVYDATPQDYVNLICSLNSQKSNSKYLQDLQPTTITAQIHLLISITHHSLPFIHSTRRETTPGWSRNSGEHLQILVKVEQLIELK